MLMCLKIDCRFLILFHCSVQLFVAALLVVHQMQLFQKAQPFFHQRLRQRGVKYQNQHKADTQHIQHDSQIENRQDSCEITMHKALSKHDDRQSDQHQNRLISNGDDHKHQCCYRDRDIFAPHIIDLRRLSAGRGRRDAAKEKTDR